MSHDTCVLCVMIMNWEVNVHQPIIQLIWVDIRLSTNAAEKRQAQVEQ